MTLGKYGSTTLGRYILEYKPTGAWRTLEAFDAADDDEAARVHEKEVAREPLCSLRLVRETGYRSGIVLREHDEARR